MIYQVKTVQGVKKLIPISGSAPVGNPVGTLITTYKKIQPRNYLYCDGRDTTGTEEELRTHYPALYMYLGSNVLPDFRECVMVGAEENTTDTIATHDVYAQGEFKDDQLQDHKREIRLNNTLLGYYQTTATQGNNMGGLGTASSVTLYAKNIASGRTGTPDVTHGKQKAVYVYIKAVDGVDISDEDSFLGVVQNYVDERINALTPRHVNLDGVTGSGIASSNWDILEFGTFCLCIGLNKYSFTPSTGVSMQLPTGYTIVQIISANVFCSGNTQWVTGTSHVSGNGAYTYITGSQSVSKGCFRQIVLATKNVS